MFLASQIVGVFAFAVYITSYWQKDRRKLLILSIIECVLFAVQYFLLGSLTGAIVNLIGIVRSTSFMYKNKNKFMSGYFMPAIIHAAYLLNGIFTWEGWITLLPTIASFMKCHLMWQNKTKAIRMYGLPIQIMWLGYGIYLGSYVSIVSQIILMISITVAIIRLDILKDRKPNYKIKINVFLNALEKIYKSNNQNFVYDIGAIQNPDFIKLVCLKGNKPIGYVALYPHSDFLEQQGFPKEFEVSDFSVFIWHIVVRKGYERKGVATALLQEIEKVYQGYEIYSVLDSRNNPSILFHSAKGFVKRQDFARVYFGKISKFDIMQFKGATKEVGTKKEPTPAAQATTAPAEVAM